MSKRILWILTIALSLSMLGLIIVQIKWIKNAIELNDKQFRQLVNTTLSETSRQIEHFYTSKRMQTLMEDKEKLPSEIEWNIRIEDKSTPIIFMEGDSLTEVKVPPKGLDHEEMIEVINDTILVISHNGRSTIDTINIALYQDQEKLKKIEESIKEQEIMVKTVMKKMLLEDLSFEERVDQHEFESILSKNILNSDIDLDFEYTVIKNNNQEIYSSKGFDKKTDCYYFRAGLMSDKILDDNTFLYLYFPGQKEHIRESMGVLGSSTVILTLLMIFLFSFALYVIFRQKKLSDIKNDFVNNMTHELKTPISTISLASQMLNDDSIPDEKKKTGHISRIIQTESKRLGYQVERVLQMAVLDQGHLVLKKSPLGMQEIIGTVIQNFKIQVESLGGKLSFIDEAENDLVNGDRVHLMNVVTNLMDNAVKYSKEKPEIEVWVGNSRNSFILSVKDNGIGISKENHKKVFERFFRVSTGNVHDVKGFGLGLSYVKLIVDQHGGSINLNSELNKGTKFEIKLPLYSETQTS